MSLLSLLAAGCSQTAQTSINSSTTPTTQSTLPVTKDVSASAEKNPITQVAGEGNSNSASNPKVVDSNVSSTANFNQHFSNDTLGLSMDYPSDWKEVGADVDSDGNPTKAFMSTQGSRGDTFIITKFSSLDLIPQSSGKPFSDLATQNVTFKNGILKAHVKSDDGGNGYLFLKRIFWIQTGGAYYMITFQVLDMKNSYQTGMTLTADETSLMNGLLQRVLFK
ncbi:MAG: hypothetical protein JWO40_241 [Candidatus Doudnabacteria bacterium]|nr:hypothetical protein [Candidatus Doudnabacteria bacterium]